MHEVAIATVALGRGEVTVGEFRHFVGATGHVTDAEGTWNEPSYRVWRQGFRVVEIR